MSPTQPLEERLRPKIRNLIAIDRVTGFQADQLDAEDLESLIHVVTREVVPQDPFDMGKAITALALAGTPNQTAKVLSRFLADERESATDRAIAAIGLRTIPGPDSLRALIANLRVADHRVQLEVIKSIGAYGDEDALRQMEGLPTPDQEAVRKQLALAKALIAHRLGLPDRHLPKRRGVARKPGSEDDMIKLSLRRKLAKTIRADRMRLVGSTYGIEVGDRGFGLQAGDARWTLFINEELGQGPNFSPLFDRTWITALLARWQDSTNTSAVQYFVLTDPTGNSAEINVVRTDGEIFYTGQITRTRKVTSFTVRDVARAGTAPTNVHGHLTARGVVLDVTIPFGRRKNTRSGEAIEVPSAPLEFL